MRKAQKPQGYAALLAVLIALSSCGKQPAEKPSVSDSTPGNNTAPITETTENHLTDSIAEQDFGGYEFRYLATANGGGIASRFIDEMWVEEDHADVILSAVYQRNRLLSERLNITIVAEADDAPAQKLRTTVLAGQDSYDMVGAFKVDSFSLAIDGLLRDWNDFTIDYEQPWWSQAAREKLQICGRQYLMSGSILISEIDDTLAMTYNKTIAEQHDIADIYSMVANGTWYLDDFLKICTQISSDLNGDGKMTVGDDLYGYIQDPNSMTYNWFFACDLLNGYVDTNGEYQTNVNFDRIQTLIDKLSPFIAGSNVATNVDLYEGLDYYKENKIFMYAIILRNLEMLRDMNIDFGIIPYPKMDETQQFYATHVGSASPILTIPLTNTQNDARLSAILDAMALSSHEIMIPAYYDTALKDKITRDPQSAEMLDIILAARTYDISYLGGNGVVQVGSNLLLTGKTDFSSAWAKQEKAIKRQLQKIIDNMLSHE